MSNRLKLETSPYLLQHADNPVDWYPWGPEALDKARQEDKPIFLSIGYAACHWCHVMAHESFEDPSTAALLNQHYVAIKVDREERPDLDNVYMDAVVAMTGQGGWPMSVFLTPEGKPFYSGTYFPPVARHGLPAFRDVLTQLARAWVEDREQIDQIGAEIAGHLKEATQWGADPQTLRPSMLRDAAEVMALSYDWEHGGWGDAPKFPQPMSIEFLLRMATRDDAPALKIANHYLTTMARGGLYDVVGGGFHRYSTDADWLVPHFEKMLYDNAQLALAYLHAHLLTGSPLYRRICEETLDFILREMTGPEGGFYSSLDADSEGREGLYYLWSREELAAALDGGDDFALFEAAYGLQPNFEGRIILQRAAGDPELAGRFGLPLDAVPPRLRELHQRLLQARQRRVRPATDDKALVGWNALALQAFAEAGRYLNRPDYLAAAGRNAGFLLANLHDGGKLLRSWRAGRANHNACLEDYAALIIALLALYQSDPQVRWYTAADQLTQAMVAHFSDPRGGFFDTRDDQDALITRPKQIQDNATPSGNALAAFALLAMAEYTGRGDWRDAAEAMLGTAQRMAAKYPTAFSYWLCAMDLAIGPVRQVAILSPTAPAEDALHPTLWSTYRPRLVAAVSAYPPEPGSPPLLADRPLRDGGSTAYVCQGFVCRQPVTTPSALAAQLD